MTTRCHYEVTSASASSPARSAAAGSYALALAGGEGTYATVTARIEKAPAAPGKSTLRQTKLEAEPEAPLTELELAGIFREVVSGGVQVLLSAEDSGESEKSLTLAIPAAIQAAKLKTGNSYLATATVGGDGSLTLTGIAGDEHVKGADDAGSAQGNLKRAGASAAATPSPARVSSSR